jgi:hypothetical protein
MVVRVLSKLSAIQNAFFDPWMFWSIKVFNRTFPTDEKAISDIEKNADVINNAIITMIISGLTSIARKMVLRVCSISKKNQLLVVLSYLARESYFPVAVETRIFSPCSMNNGTSTLNPVFVMAVL